MILVTFAWVCLYLVAIEDILLKGSSRDSLRRWGQAIDCRHLQWVSELAQFFLPNLLVYEWAFPILISAGFLPWLALGQISLMCGVKCSAVSLVQLSSLPSSLPQISGTHQGVEAFSVSIWSLWFLIHRCNLHYSFCTFNCLELFPGGPELICAPFLLSCHLSSTFYWVCVQIIFWISFFFGFTTTATEQTVPAPLF